MTMRERLYQMVKAELSVDILYLLMEHLVRMTQSLLLATQEKVLQRLQLKKLLLYI